MPTLPTYAVIMAGGQGTRFWPASRKRQPKQFLSILGRRTMLQETATRLASLCPLRRTLVVVGSEHTALTRRQLPGLPAANLVAEPVGRSTAPCIALAAELILAREKDALMLVLPADHAIADAPAFRRAMKRAAAIAREEDVLVTIGIRPTFAETGYGYIETAELLDSGSPAAHAAAGFHEKPDARTAAAYCESGRFLWNSGMFVWRASVIREQIRRHLPATAAALEPVARARTRRALEEALRRAYRRVDAISIDHGVMEKAARVAVVTGDFGWNDVGSWAAMPEVWGADGERNTTRGPVLAIESGSNIVVAEKRLVALLGMDDCIVVDTPDALLVCRRERAQDVRLVVDALKRRGGSKLL